MSAPGNLPLRTLIEGLERRVAQLQREIDRLQQQPALEQWYQCRLAKTTSDSTYPAQGSGDTFEFVFVDLDYTRTEGTQSGTFKDGSADSQGVGKAADESWIPEDTYCLAVEQPNGFWLLIPLECP